MTQGGLPIEAPAFKPESSPEDGCMFTESNTVEQMILDTGALDLCLLRSGSAPAYLSQNRARAMFNKG